MVEAVDGAAPTSSRKLLVIFAWILDHQVSRQQLKGMLGLWN